MFSIPSCVFCGVVCGCQEQQGIVLALDARENTESTRKARTKAGESCITCSQELGKHPRLQLKGNKTRRKSNAGKVRCRNSLVGVHVVSVAASLVQKPSGNEHIVQ